MARKTAAFVVSLLPLVSACSQERLPPAPFDCSVADAYEFLNISNFDGTESGWFQYADPTPGGSPDTVRDGSNVPVSEVVPPRCGDGRALKLEMSGKNFWGAGFGDWAHNTSPADGTGYEGLSFWARSPSNAEKQFFFNVDDKRTILLPPPAPDAGLLPPATPADQDLDGDGFVGPGDVARDTECRLPPSEAVAGDVACYNGGVNAPASGGVRVPAPNECGNAFHTRITTSDVWQLFLVPWSELGQWPCPNRLEGGIRRNDIAKFEIRFDQGTHYELWLDNIAFYRSRGN